LLSKTLNDGLSGRWVAYTQLPIATSPIHQRAIKAAVHADTVAIGGRPRSYSEVRVQKVIGEMTSPILCTSVSISMVCTWSWTMRHGAGWAITQFFETSDIRHNYTITEPKEVIRSVATW